MLCWFLGTAIVAVWFVFRDPGFDYRLLVIGAVLPDLDALAGGARALHSLAVSIVLLVGVVIITIGRRPLRRVLLGLPIGTMLHLVFDGAWADSRVFAWPLFGVAFDGARLPAAARGWWNVVFEAVGVAILVWVWRRASVTRPSVAKCCGLASCSPDHRERSEKLGVEHSRVLILVRHGRTALNAAGLLQGRLDEPLDEVGQAQAVAVAALVGPVEELIASPLRRAQQTAAAFGVPFVTDDRWVELSYGIYEGVPHADVPSEAWDHWRADPSYVPPGGESLATLDQRVRGACEELAEQASGRDVAIVTHVSPIKSAVAWALGAGVEIAWRSHLSHASVCRIDLRRTGPVLCTFNETAG